MQTLMATRTEFSLGESILQVKDLIETAKAQGAKVVAVTDTMSVTSMIDLSSKAKEAGIKPVIGCRLRLVDDVTWRKKRGIKDRPESYYVTWYALSENGVKGLFDLLTTANSEDRFYETSKLSFDDLYSALDTMNVDDVVIATCDAHSVIHHKDAETILSEITARLSVSNVFAMLVPAKTPYWDTLNVKAIELSRKLGISTLTARPVFYDRNRSDAQEVMSAIWNNDELSSIWHNSNHLSNFEPLGSKEFAIEVRDAAQRLQQRGVSSPGSAFKDGIAAADRIVKAVTYEWAKQEVSLPQMAPDEYAELVNQCKLGWKKRFTKHVFGHCPTADELRDKYKPRLKYELSVLKQLGFAGYFLLVQDLVQHAKSQDILVGPGRGSVGGSLIAYLLEITECDPIRFNLLFERFINPDRLDLPDADLDFMSARRGEVIQYLIDKYGKDRVAGISNFGTLGPSSAIRQVGKAFGLSERDYGISKLVPKEHGNSAPLEKAAEEVAEIGAFKSKYEPVWDICLQLEGVMRNLASHAAGVVVGGCDLKERAVIERRKSESVVCWDKRVVEDMGLVKMDILGLSTLDLIAQTQEFIEKRHGKIIDLGQIPLDDDKVLQNFSKGMTTGIFQFDGAGMKKLLRDLGEYGTLEFEDIVAATALYRPGPMDSGMLDDYVKRKRGDDEVSFDHPAMQDALSPTYGVAVYQEQVMQIARDVAGYSMAEADKLRKIMGKKLPEEMAKQRDKFVAGCVSHINMGEYEAGELFDKIEKFAGYGFNRSHSVEYTLISYQSMYLKTYYTVEFISAALSLMKEEKLPALLRDAERLGIDVQLPDINLSGKVFEILDDTTTIIPFSAVKQISAKAADAIMTVREDGPIKSREDLEKRLSDKKIKRFCNVRCINNLDAVGAFARITPGSKAVDHPDRIKDQRELLPGLIAKTVPIHRDMHTDRITKAAIVSLINEYQTAHGPNGEDEDGMPVRPMLGKNAKFMVVVDAPNSTEERNGQLTTSQAFQPISEALHEAGMSRSEGYFTALLKRPKEGKMVSAEEITKYGPYLDREIEIMKPPVIVLLGSASVRKFIPDFKGKASDQAGTIVYDKERDINLVLGFSPGEIYFDETKQPLMNEVFEKVSSMID